VKRRLAQLAIRLGHQGSPTRHLYILDVPIGKGHVELHLACERVVEPAPGVQTIHIQICRERLHLRFHLLLAFGPHATHRVLGLLERGVNQHRREVMLAERGQDRLQGRVEFRVLRMQRRHPSLVRLHRLIVCIVGRRATQISRQVAKPLAKSLKIIDHAHDSGSGLRQGP